MPNTRSKDPVKRLLRREVPTSPAYVVFILGFVAANAVFASQSQPPPPSNDHCIATEPAHALVLDDATLEPARGEMTKLHKTGMNVVRRLSEGNQSYIEVLGPEFAADVKKLGPEAHWFDSGGGEGNATEDYLAQGGTARISMLSLETSKESRNRYQVFKGRLLEEIPNSELGKASLITDVMGPFAYSDHLKLVIEKYLSLLDDGGKIYLSTGNHEANLGGIFSSSGRSDFLQWLKKIKGINVRTYKPNDPRNRIITYIIEKSPQESTLVIPSGDLELVYKDRRLPPIRYYIEKASPADSVEKFKIEPGLFSAQTSKHISETIRNWNVPGQNWHSGKDFQGDFFAIQALERRKFANHPSPHWIHFTEDSPFFLERLNKLRDAYIASSRQAHKRTLRGKLGKVFGVNSKLEAEKFPVPDVRAELENGHFDGPAQIVSDTLGPFLKSGRPDLVLKKYLSLIEDNGNIVLTLPSHMGRYPHTRYFPEPVVLTYNSSTKTYNRTLLFEWLRQIPGLSVNVVNLEYNIAHVTIKNRADIKIPALRPFGLVPSHNIAPEIIFIEDVSH